MDQRNKAKLKRWQNEGGMKEEWGAHTQVEGGKHNSKEVLSLPVELF